MNNNPWVDECRCPRCVAMKSLTAWVDRHRFWLGVLIGFTGACWGWLLAAR